MKITGKTTIEEMGAMVSQSLLDNGIEAFLSGGAVVSIYTKNKYESFDLDFVTFGDSPIEEFTERKVRKNLLKILTPTGCIKDRLAAYIHWKDKQGLAQAILVATAQPFKLKEIEKFCKNEGKPEAFDDFLQSLKRFKK